MFASNVLSEALSTAKEVYDQLNKHWIVDPLTDRLGMFRPGYSAEESEAIEIISGRAFAVGCTKSEDIAGNVYLTYPGKDRNLPAVLMGSHLDSVPNGGAYDGPAGVVAALTAVNLIHQEGIKPAQDVVITILRAEESPWFGKALMGSSMVCGLSDPSILDFKRFDTGKTLAVHMQEIGLDSGRLSAALEKKKPSIPVDRIRCFIEAHIEQAPRLAQGGEDLGLVTAIRGNLRFKELIKIFGEAAHTGSTPQDMRRDALIVGARIISAFDERCRKIQTSGKDIVWSVPHGETPGSSRTTVAREFGFLPEVRSTSIRVLEEMKRWISVYARSIAREAGLRVENCEGEISKPVKLNENVLKFSATHASLQRLRYMTMPSGAGHDAMNFQSAGVPTGMLFLAHGNNGISHNPREIMAPDGVDQFDVSAPFACAARHMATLALNISTAEKFPPAMKGLSFEKALEKLTL